MTTSNQIPVLIVGGGPVGLGLAIDLGWRGIDCLLVEQGDGSIYHPRANTVNSSPPMRPARSPRASCFWMRSATSTSRRSPMPWL